jgi:hypothetical protein
LRFTDTNAEVADILDELSQGGSEIVAEVSPRGFLPEGWLETLLRSRPGETQGLGVLALPLEGREPNGGPIERIGGAAVLRASAANEAFAQAPVRLVARDLLERFGPHSGVQFDPPAWQRMAERLERRGYVNGFPWPLQVVRGGAPA